VLPASSASSDDTQEESPPEVHNTAEVSLPVIERTAPLPAEPAPSAAVVIAAWQQWAGIVEALRAGSAVPLNEASYQKLQRDLVAACRALAATTEADERDRWQRMADVVQPWLSLKVLATTDHETLASLSNRVQGIAAELGLPRSSAWPWIVSVTMVAVLAVVGWWLITSRAGSVAVSSLGTWWPMIEKHPVLALSGAIPGFLLMALFLLKRVLR
jgi:hypothetical protein